MVLGRVVVVVGSPWIKGVGWLVIVVGVAGPGAVGAVPGVVEFRDVDSELVDGLVVVEVAPSAVGSEV